MQEDYMFMTENTEKKEEQEPEEKQEEFVIKFQPSNLKDIFKSMEENNIREIENLHEKEDNLYMAMKKHNIL